MQQRVPPYLSFGSVTNTVTVKDLKKYAATGGCALSNLRMGVPLQDEALAPCSPRHVRLNPGTMSHTRYSL
jgi:hypothetical protein